MKIIPVENRVLVQLPEKKEKTEGGLFIPGNIDEKKDLLDGEVLAVGPGETIDGQYIRTPPCQVGQVVLFANFSGSPIKVNDTDCVLLHGSEIMAIKEQ